MAKMLLPDSRRRSATAVPDKADVRGGFLYSALLVNHAATGQQKVFTNPQGQPIPRLAGTAIGTAQAHQTTYSEATTNLTKAGEAGSSIGDFAVRKMGITIENGSYDASGALRAYGAGQQEVTEILYKTSFQFKTAGREQITGVTFLFPAAGGLYGGVSTSESAVTVSSLTNGFPGPALKLPVPILVERTDTLEGVFTVASSSSLAFSATSDPGQPTLIWFVLGIVQKTDVR